MCHRSKVNPPASIGVANHVSKVADSLKRSNQKGKNINTCEFFHSLVKCSISKSKESKPCLMELLSSS
ncbi:hypothetical protein Peur_068112 [Populus x canadensis]